MIIRIKKAITSLGLASIVAILGCATLRNEWHSGDKNPEIVPGAVIERLLKNGERVTLAIVVKSLNNQAAKALEVRYENRYGKNPGATARLMDDWARETETSLIVDESRAFLGKFSRHPNFRLVDRDATEKILEELKFQMQGFTREVDAPKIGQFLNATHLLVVRSIEP